MTGSSELPSFLVGLVCVTGLGCSAGVPVMKDIGSFYHTREALLSEAGFEKFSGPRIGSVGASSFVDDFASCWGKRGAYRLLLEPT